MLTLSSQRIFPNYNVTNLYSSATRIGASSPFVHYSSSDKPHDMHRVLARREFYPISQQTSNPKMYSAVLKQHTFHGIENLGISRFNVSKIKPNNNSLEFTFSHHSKESPDIKAIYFTDKPNIPGITDGEFPIFLVGGKCDKPTVDESEDFIKVTLATNVEGVFQLDLGQLAKAVSDFTLKHSFPTSAAFYKIYPHTTIRDSVKTLADVACSLNQIAEIDAKGLVNLLNNNLEIQFIAERRRKPLFYYDKWFKITSQTQKQLQP